MNNNIYNPFVECTARDMTYEEVFQYWCSPFNCYKLDEKMLFNSLTPVFIQGARGAGKTMILKYLSYYCQKELALNQGESNLYDYFCEKGSIGFYFRYKDDFGGIFRSLNCSNDSKEILFMYYFELYIVHEILTVINDLYISSNIIEGLLNLEKLVGQILRVDIGSLNSYIEHIKTQIDHVDDWVRKSRYIGDAEEDLRQRIYYTDIIRKVCRSIRASIPKFNNIRFMIIIDEYENASHYQKQLNTMFKQVDSTDNITFRVGMRPQGLYTNETNIGNEFLQPDRDYLLLSLRIKKINDYKSFIHEVANRRLEKVDIFYQAKFTDIKEILGNKEDLVFEAKELIKNRSNKHFEILKTKLPEGIEFDKAVEMLKCPNDPLIEMLNIVWVLRGKTVEYTSEAMRLYLLRKYNKNSKNPMEQAAYKYKLDYIDKYKYQMLFSLLSIYGANKNYYSFNTFAYLSSGAVNDFISLCRNTFYRLDDYFYSNIIVNKRISMIDQAKGAVDTAIEQMDKIKLCDEDGTEMYTFAINIGNLFKNFHKDINGTYPETNQFAFKDEAEIEKRPLLKGVLNNLIKWGVVIRKIKPQSISIGRKRGNIYILNRIFSPLFNISYRTRGGYNFIVSTSLFENTLNSLMEPNEMKNWDKNESKKQIINKRVAETPAPTAQLSLFEGDFDE